MLTWQLHTEKRDSLPAPGNSTHTKNGWGKATGSLKSLSLETPGHKIGEQWQLWWTSTHDRNFQVLLFPVASFYASRAHKTPTFHTTNWEDMPVLYPKWWLNLQRFGGFVNGNPSLPTTRCFGSKSYPTLLIQTTPLLRAFTKQQEPHDGVNIIDHHVCNAESPQRWRERIVSEVVCSSISNHGLPLVRSQTLPL